MGPTGVRPGPAPLAPTFWLRLRRAALHLPYRHTRAADTGSPMATHDGLGPAQDLSSPSERADGRER